MTYYANSSTPYGIKDVKELDEVIVPSDVVSTPPINLPQESPEESPQESHEETPQESYGGSPVSSTDFSHLFTTFMPQVSIPQPVATSIVIPASIAGGGTSKASAIKSKPNKIQKKSKPHVSASKYKVGDLYTTDENVVFKVGLTSNGKKWWFKN